MSVSVADVLDNLISVSAAPSTLGAQLDRLRLGTHSAPDPFRARDDVENHLIQQAALIRCIDQFTARQVLPIPRPAIIEKIQKETHTDQGRIAVAVLRAYHERSTRSQERGMVEVYRLLARMAPETTPPSPTEDTLDLVQLFREGKARRCRAFSCEAYADSLLGLQQHVRIWARKQRALEDDS